jgi:polar amino acid transport system substrate-binding protein
MNRFTIVLAGLLACVLSPLTAVAQPLPDLGGRTITVVTENAYPPLQFVDPKTGGKIGWEYDAMANTISA